MAEPPDGPSRATRDPRRAMEQYLATLPAGLASFPLCQVKGAVLAGLVEGSPVPFPREGLPAPLLALLDEPPLPSDWIPEVHFNALMIAQEAQLEPDALERWVYDRNRRLLRSPLYAILFRLIGPARVFTGMTHRWRAFRRGTELVLIEKGERRVVVEVRYPSRLYPESTMLNFCVATRAALDAAGAEFSQVSLVMHGPERARLLAEWR